MLHHPPSGFIRPLWYLALGTAGLVLVLATLPPFVPASFQMVLRQAFVPLCHQLPSRSFMVDGIPLAVCQRCYGIYWGLFVGVLWFPLAYRLDGWLWAHSKPIVLLALSLLALDWGLHLIGWWDNTVLSRLLTGWLFGLVAGYCLARATVPPSTATSFSSQSKAVNCLDP